MEKLVCVSLLRLWLKAWPLEFNEERLATWHPEDPIRPAGVTWDPQLAADDPKVDPGVPDRLKLNWVFKQPPHLSI